MRNTGSAGSIPFGIGLQRVTTSGPTRALEEPRAGNYRARVGGSPGKLGTTVTETGKEWGFPDRGRMKLMCPDYCLWWWSVWVNRALKVQRLKYPSIVCIYCIHLLVSICKRWIEKMYTYKPRNENACAAHMSRFVQSHKGNRWILKMLIGTCS